MALGFPSKRHAIFWQGTGYPNFGAVRTTCIKGAPVAGTRDTSLGGRAEISAIESTLFMFLLPLKKGGNSVAQMGEHRARISLSVDRRF